MNRRFLALALALTLTVLCVSCAGQEQDGGYQLYFSVSAGVGHGPAIETEPLSWTADVPPTPEELLSALLAGPTDELLASPFPRGVTLVRCEEDGERPGHWRVVLSEQYSGLTDISLTIADYCIVLTLTQLEGVDSVELSSSGYSANYRSHPVLLPEEALLDDTRSTQEPAAS